MRPWKDMQAMSDQYGDRPGDQDRPGPYQGVFGGQSGAQPGPQPGPPKPGTGPYSYQPDQSPAPKQVTIASVISFGLGGLCVLLGLFSLTSAGEQIAETLTGSRDSQGLVVSVVLACAVAYILPAIFLRKRRPWARIMLIVVAAFGITGGVTALPSSILGLALHITLLVLMLQPPTKHWFTTRR